MTKTASPELLHFREMTVLAMSPGSVAADNRVQERSHEGRAYRIAATEAERRARTVGGGEQD
jgi:hypothetical protein